MLWEKMLSMDKDSPIPFRADGKTLTELENKFSYEDKFSFNKPVPLIEKRLFYTNEQITF